MRDPRTGGVSGGGGPGRWVLIAGGILVAVLLVALLGGVASVPRMLAWGLGTTRDRVLAALPSDATPIQRQQLRRSFDCVIRSARAGRVGEAELGELSRACNDALADRKLSTEERQVIGTLLQSLCPTRSEL